MQRMVESINQTSQKDLHRKSKSFSKHMSMRTSMSLTQQSALTDRSNSAEVRAHTGRSQ